MYVGMSEEVFEGVVDGNNWVMNYLLSFFTIYPIYKRNARIAWLS